MSEYVSYKDLKVINPLPSSGTPARTIDDNFRIIADKTSNIQVLGRYPATNWFGAQAQFVGNNDSVGIQVEFGIEGGFGGLFLSALNTTSVCGCCGKKGWCNCKCISCSTGHINGCGNWCNNGYNNDFLLWAINPELINFFEVDLMEFVINPEVIKYLTRLTLLRLNFMQIDSALDISNLPVLEQLTLHFTINEGSLSISDLPELTKLYSAGDGGSYGGMHNLTDSNFSLDIATLPKLDGLVLISNPELTTNFIDNVFIELAASVVANPRPGFAILGGSNNNVSSASAAAREALVAAGDNQWDLDYNSGG